MVGNGEMNRNMAEVLASFDTPIADRFGTFRARAVGRQAGDGMWDGWIEFLPVDGNSELLVGGVESRQPERHDLVYWATGLSPVYLEGALQRARNPIGVRYRPVEIPASTAPAPRAVAGARSLSQGPEPVLDPFEIGRRSLNVLRQELRALNRPRLVNIITAHELNPADEDLQWMSDRQLVQFIVTAVEAQMMQRTR
jgi:hypothetical protein